MACSAVLACVASHVFNVSFEYTTAHNFGLLSQILPFTFLAQWDVALKSCVEVQEYVMKDPDISYLSAQRWSELVGGCCDIGRFATIKGTV